MVVVVKTTTSLKNERVRSVSKEGDGGGGEDTPTPLKTSAYTQFWGRGMVVVMKTTTCLENERIRSVSKEGDGGGLLVGVGWWWWLWQNTTLENECMCSFSRVVDGGGCHVMSGEKDKKIKRGRTLRPPLLMLPSSWWWHLQLQVVSPSLSIRTCSRRCRRRCHLLAPTWWWWWERSWRGVKFEFGTSTYMWRVQSHDSTPEFGLREFSKWFDFFPTLTGVKILEIFTPVKVVIYASILHCEKLPFVVEKF